MKRSVSGKVNYKTFKYFTLKQLPQAEESAEKLTSPPLHPKEERSCPAAFPSL